MFTVAHNVIRAHARAWHSYDRCFRPTQSGQQCSSLNDLSVRLLTNLLLLLEIYIARKPWNSLSVEFLCDSFRLLYLFTSVVSTVWEDRWYWRHSWRQKWCHLTSRVSVVYDFAANFHLFFIQQSILCSLHNCWNCGFDILNRSTFDEESQSGQQCNSLNDLSVWLLTNLLLLLEIYIARKPWNSLRISCVVDVHKKLFLYFHSSDLDLCPFDLKFPFTVTCVYRRVITKFEVSLYDFQ